MRPRICAVAGLGLAIFSLTVRDAGAGPTAPPPVFAGGRNAAPAPYNLPPAPALPAGCATPTKDQCADSKWYEGDACAKDAAKGGAVRAYCTWVVQKGWADTQQTVRPVIVPVAAPNAPDAVLPPGTRVDNGKSVAPQKSNLPSHKRRFGSGHRAAGQWKASAATRVDWTPSQAKPGGGTYTGLATGAIVPDLRPIAQQMEPFHTAPPTKVDPKLNAAAAALSALATKQPLFVLPGSAIGSCEDYVYKRYGDYSAFAYAAKRMGTNYRQIYNLAMDPRSPVFINRAGLSQLGVAAPIPTQVKQVLGSHGIDSLPANAFVTQYPAWLDDPKVIVKNGKPLVSEAEKAQLRALLKPGRSLTVVAKSDQSPFGVHREMKDLFDKKYGDPLDDELIDADKRTAMYQTAREKEYGLGREAFCTLPGDLCFRCTEPPGTQGRTTGALGKLRDKITGQPVINPGDMGSVFFSGSPAARMQSLARMSKVGPELNALLNAARAQLPQGGAAKGGMKQKPAEDRAPIANPNINDTTDYCSRSEASIAALHNTIVQAMIEVEQSMALMLANELKYGVRGCLADPGGDIGNMCDWSYAKFTAVASTLMDDAMEADFQVCQSTLSESLGKLTNPPNSGGFNTILKHVENQKLVYPCVQRRDFTTNAVETWNYLDLVDFQATGRFCESMWQALSVTQQQDEAGKHLRPLKWKPGEISDRQADALILGDLDSLGAKFDYDAGWSLKGEGAPKGGDPMATCKFQGAGNAGVHAGIYFFGDELKLFGLDSSGTANSDPTVTMSAYYLDIDSFSTKFVPGANKKHIAPGKSFVVPLVQPPINLGGIEYSFYVQAGPVPIEITFGATATAGIDYHFEAKGGNNCADMKKPSGFRLLTQVEPWVRADAYAEASVTLVIVSAGVRLDLNLLKLGLPMGVDLSTVGSNYVFKNGGRITIDMLSGKLSAYVSFGIGPLSAEYDVKIFGWDGFHTDIPLWGIDKTVSEADVRAVMAPMPTAETVSCKCDAAANFCCSNLSCAEKVATCGPNKTKNIGGTKYTCSFTQADLQTLDAASKKAWDDWVAGGRKGNYPPLASGAVTTCPISCQCARFATDKK